MEVLHNVSVLLLGYGNRCGPGDLSKEAAGRYHAKEMAQAELHRFEQGVMEERPPALKKIAFWRG